MNSIIWLLGCVSKWSVFSFHCVHCLCFLFILLCSSNNCPNCLYRRLRINVRCCCELILDIGLFASCLDWIRSVECKVLKYCFLFLSHLCLFPFSCCWAGTIVVWLVWLAVLFWVLGLTPSVLAESLLLFDLVVFYHSFNNSHPQCWCVIWC